MLPEIKVLVVEDDMTSREMLSEMLESNGALCTAVTNGREAMEVIVFNPDIDIVLLDLHMPVMDGFEVLVQLKSNPYLSDIPVIVMTTDHHEKLRSLKLGADDFLAKPYNQEELELRISKLVTLRRKAQSAKQAKSDFLSIVSHELRTPSHNMMGLADLLESQNPDGEQRKLINLMKENTGCLTSTIDDILSFVQLDHGTDSTIAEHFSLRGTTQAVLESQKDSARLKGIKLVLSIADDVSDRLNGPSAYVHKIFSILIGNAIKFSSDGEVRISITEESLGDFSSRFCCCVHDQGPGVPTGFSEKIFEPFVQVKHSSGRTYDGIGLGLAIAKRMVEMMGGNINVTNDADSGSSFNFSFRCSLHGTAELL
ncbi:MAG: hybrid sensor histidine kinase/response regulator [Proteobacteria bacterium]|nr:hybrid sensor histidine kinase/response regulator [Pseudomonadota bacterium]